MPRRMNRFEFPRKLLDFRPSYLDDQTVTIALIGRKHGLLITIPLSAEDLARVRIAPSPLWETVTSFGVLLRHGRDSVHAPWLVRARRVLAGADLSPLATAMCVSGHYPDFLSPRPASASATFEEELERVRCTPPEVVFDQVSCLVWQEKECLRRLRPEQEILLEGILSDPEGAVRRLADALRRYHELAIVPHWPRIREHLEGDTIRRGRTLALGGVEALLFDLNPNVAYSGNAVELGMPYEATVRTMGRGVTLVPSVFSWPTVSVLAHPHSQPALAYATRGVANLWSSSRPAPDGTALEAALGTGRAGVRAQSPTRAAHYHRASRGSRPEPRRGLRPPLAAQGRRLGRAPPHREEGLLPPERRRRVAARGVRRNGVAEPPPHARSEGTNGDSPTSPRHRSVTHLCTSFGGNVGRKHRRVARFWASVSVVATLAWGELRGAGGEGAVAVRDPPPLLRAAQVVRVGWCSRGGRVVEGVTAARLRASRPETVASPSGDAFLLR